MASNHGRKSRAQGLLYLGVDLGTTQLKAGLFDERGSMVASASMGYPTHRRQRNAAEQDGDDWWKALCACCRQLQVDGDGAKAFSKRVAAVCIVGQGPSVVAADGHGNPVRLAVTWAERVARKKQTS